MKGALWLLLCILIGGGVWIIIARHRITVPVAPADNGPAAEQAQGTALQDIHQQLITFGDILKNVSLLSPTAGADMQREYPRYVTRSLLANWVAHPDLALGKTTSSPWPDHIDISDIQIAPDGSYTVRAMVVYMTSNEAVHGGDAGATTIQCILRTEDGLWKVDSVTVLAKYQPNAARSVEDKPLLE